MKMSTKSLDQLDYKILYELDKDARASYTAMAKVLHISKQTVKNRVEKLMKEKVITHFITIINMANFGYIPYKVFISFRNVYELS